MNFSDILGWFSFCYCCNLGRVNNNTFLGYNVTKKCYFTEPKFTFTELGIELVLSKLFHYQTKMFFMFFIALRINQYVINKDYDKLV
jgi:hypothetical protein